MTERTLREQISELIEDAILHAEVDYPVDERAGHRIDWPHEQLMNDIEAAIDAHTAEQPAPDAVAEADLTEEQRAEIVDAAHLAFHRSQRGIQGQVITEWHGIESHVVVETQRYLRALAKGSRT